MKKTTYYPISALPYSQRRALIETYQSYRLRGVPALKAIKSAHYVHGISKEKA